MFDVHLLILSKFGILLILMNSILTCKTVQIMLWNVIIVSRAIHLPVPHPTLPLFVQTIEIESRNQVDCLNDIRCGRVVHRVLQETTINTIPLYYTSFVVN